MNAKSTYPQIGRSACIGKLIVTCPSYIMVSAYAIFTFTSHHMLVIWPLALAGTYSLALHWLVLRAWPSKCLFHARLLTYDIPYDRICISGLIACCSALAFGGLPLFSNSGKLITSVLSSLLMYSAWLDLKDYEKREIAVSNLPGGGTIPLSGTGSGSAS